MYVHVHDCVSLFYARLNYQMKRSRIASPTQTSHTHLGEYCWTRVQTSGARVMTSRATGAFLGAIYSTRKHRNSTVAKHRAVKIPSFLHKGELQRNLRASKKKRSRPRLYLCEHGSRAHSANTCCDFSSPPPPCS